MENPRRVLPVMGPASIPINFRNGFFRYCFKQGDDVYGQASVFGGGSGAFAELGLANKDSIAYEPAVNIGRLPIY